MRHRIFIAINLPEDIKKRLFFYQSKWPELPIRWTKKENLHITLIFLGYVSTEELPEICKITKEVALEIPAFSINLNKICYGPPEKIPRCSDESRGGWRGGWTPRMVWVEGEKSQEFAALKDNIEKSLITSEGLSFSSEKRAFLPHITLGRIKTWEWRQIEPEERPEVNEEISLSFPVQSIEVMESQLKRGGAEYTILETCSLRERY